jgi:hypothetical protein
VGGAASRGSLLDPPGGGRLTFAQVCDLAWLDLSEQVAAAVASGQLAAVVAATAGGQVDPPELGSALDDMWERLCDPDGGEPHRDRRTRALMAGLGV